MATTTTRGAWLISSAGLTIAASAKRAGAQARTLVPIKLGVTPNDDMISVVYAKQSGLFERAGLDVTIEKAQNGAAIAAAVASGAYDIGKSSTTPLFDAHAHGLPFVLIAAAAIYEASAPYGGIVTSVPLKDGRDLNGKTIGTGTSNDIGTLGIKAWMDKNGGDSQTVHHLEVPISAVPAAIEQHRIDGGEMVYPPLARALANGDLHFTPTLTAIAPTFALSAWFTTSDYSKNHPAVIRSFLRALTTAANYTNTHHAETVELLAAFTGVPAEIISKMTRVRNGTTITPALLQPVIEASVKYGDLKKSFPAAELIDPLVADQR